MPRKGSRIVAVAARGSIKRRVPWFGGIADRSTRGPAGGFLRRAADVQRLGAAR